MTSQSRIWLALAAGLAVAIAAVPAEAAKSRKHKKVVAVHRATAHVAVREYGQDRFRGGPVYNGTDYLGQDPDPFIRLQLQRDMPLYGGPD